MKIITGFNPERKELTFIVETNLLSKYYLNLKGLIEDKPHFPKDIKVIKRNETTATISFSIDESEFNIDHENHCIDVSNSGDDIKNIYMVINKFTKAALRKEFKSTEFIPLRGYPQSDIVNDVKEAVKNKRNLMLIKDYSEYLATNSNNDSGKFIYNQYPLEFGTSEWADVVITIQSPDFDLENLEKQYLPKLKETNWI